MRRTTLAGLLSMTLVGGVLYGCSQETADDGGDDDGTSAIQGGDVDTTHGFAVGVALKAGGICSGVLIAPNLVLTAQHCVSGATGERAVVCKTDKFTTTVDPSVVTVTTEGKIPAKTTYAVDEIMAPEGLDACASDLALLRLKTNIPAAAAKPATPLVTSMTLAKLDGRIAAIGYGATSATKNNAGTREIKEKIALECVPGDATRPCKSDSLASSVREFVTKGGVCLGDSGSGAFDQASLKDKPVVLGVLSRVATDGEKCSEGVYVRTDMYGPFIVTAAIDAASRGNYSIPTWALPPGSMDAGPPVLDPDAGAESGTHWYDKIGQWVKVALPFIEGAAGFLPRPTTPTTVVDAGLYVPPPTVPTTPPGGDRVTPTTTTPTTSTIPNDDSNVIKPKKAAASSGGCSAAPGETMTSFAGFGLGLAAIVAASRRRRRR